MSGKGNKKTKAALKNAADMETGLLSTSGNEDS
jgi:hypothetical protein